MTLSSQFTGSVINDMRQRDEKALAIRNAVQSFIEQGVRSHIDGEGVEYQVEEPSVAGGYGYVAKLGDAAFSVSVHGSGDVFLTLSHKDKREAHFNIDDMRSEQAVSKILATVQSIENPFGAIVTEQVKRIWEDNLKNQKFAIPGRGPLT